MKKISSIGIKWTTLVGVLSFGIIIPTFFIPQELWGKEHLVSIIIASITTYIIWNGATRIQNQIAKYYPLDKSITKHLTFEILWIFMFTSIGLTIGILTYASIVSILVSVDVLLRNIFVAFSLALLFTAIREGRTLFGLWKQSLLKQQLLEEENLKAKIESLKKQLDPHFLFNSLSVLSGIIHQDTMLADQFITQLSKVYRYVLESQQKSVVPLQQEINFVEAYFFLLKVRFEDKIQLENLLLEKDFSIAPLSLQLLIENVIKHNIASRKSPLLVSIYMREDRIWVRNNLQIRINQPHSTKIGLKNLVERYSYLSKKAVVITHKNSFFEVGIPLLK